MKENSSGKGKTIKSNIQQKDSDIVLSYVKTYIPDEIKEKLVKRLVFNLGNVAKSCKEVGINRSTYYEWMKDDLFFQEQVNDIHESSIDLVESALLDQIKDGNITAIIFFLKTKGKKRGYVEKTEIEMTQNVVPDLSHLSSTEIMDILKLAEGGE